jgi:hypothetical protein
MLSVVKLNVTQKPIVLSFIMLNVVMLSVGAPIPVSTKQLVGQVSIGQLAFDQKTSFNVVLAVFFLYQVLS